MTVAPVDDQALGAILRGQPPDLLARWAPDTTGCCYVRLCQAVLSATERPRVLSGAVRASSRDSERQAVDALIELQAEIKFVRLRHLGPAIGRLRERHSLNLFAGEALAAANHLGADVFLSAPPLRLEHGLAVEGRTRARLPVTAGHARHGPCAAIVNVRS